MIRSLIVTILVACWVVVLVLTGGRFLALLAGANADSEIIERLYRHSDFWVKPFFNMFDFSNEVVESTGGVFEPASLIAFGVYLVLGVIVLSIIGAPFGAGWFASRGHGHGHA
jgi:hypothetical protein